MLCTLTTPVTFYVSMPDNYPSDLTERLVKDIVLERLGNLTIPILGRTENVVPYVGKYSGVQILAEPMQGSTPAPNKSFLQYVVEREQ